MFTVEGHWMESHESEHASLDDALAAARQVAETHVGANVWIAGEGISFGVPPAVVEVEA